MRMIRNKTLNPPKIEKTVSFTDLVNLSNQGEGVGEEEIECPDTFLVLITRITRIGQFRTDGEQQT